jgi:hypothetical protein
MILPGMALLCFGFIHFEEKGNEYTWPNVSTNFNNNSIKILDINEKPIVDGVC